VDTIEQALRLGAQRAIVGTAAIEEPEVVREACRRYPNRIIVSVDAREGMVATRGWREGTQVSVEDLIERMKALGARRFLCTDIAKDGTLTEPSFGLYERLVRLGVAVIASGGVAKIEHLVRLSRIGVEGAIVGKALYTGDLDLRQALARVEEEGRVSA
ncbi:MAG: 1-(5-phosphoribosyl)-5-((5-phosphoribosylamino)methylideneamino)imidazole-4-carboxamide isomerase, partial [Chloroflexi bacterium]|nr:1-(5-phosphoribosyl)-5-((5-phosphoribosylamino)methylideneamino)imidazole-4-carboxamide isomerase [Chloroflexota bacterium]